MDYLAMNKTADERNLELRSELSDLQELLEKVKAASDYLRNTFDDLLPNDKTKTLFELSNKVSQIKKTL